jgi:hypothetical protein
LDLCQLQLKCRVLGVGVVGLDHDDVVLPAPLAPSRAAAYLMTQGARSFRMGEPAEVVHHPRERIHKHGPRTAVQRALSLPPTAPTTAQSHPPIPIPNLGFPARTTFKVNLKLIYSGSHYSVPLLCNSGDAALQKLEALRGSLELNEEDKVHRC